MSNGAKAMSNGRGVDVVGEGKVGESERTGVVKGDGLFRVAVVQGVISGCRQGKSAR